MSRTAVNNHTVHSKKHIIHTNEELIQKTNDSELGGEELKRSVSRKPVKSKVAEKQGAAEEGEVSRDSAEEDTYTSTAHPLGRRCAWDSGHGNVEQNETRNGSCERTPTEKSAEEQSNCRKASVPDWKDETWMNGSGTGVVVEAGIRGTRRAGIDAEGSHGVRGPADRGASPWLGKFSQVRVRAGLRIDSFWRSAARPALLDLEKFKLMIPKT
ncbi:hypothetical protein C8R43DRAFT_944824 [Mycena crocata]|nr:hypothetical protein C8R43DRAFT_944824 [Mycena crocata]